MLTKARINKAIRHLNLKVVGNGDGYFYFVDTTNGDTRGSNVDAPRLNVLSLQQWEAAAKAARNSKITNGFEEPNFLELSKRYKI
jgi:hypothetical protein